MILWLSREQIVGDVIAEQLAANGLEATYTIDSVLADRQVISNLRFGPPSDPDAFVEQVVIHLQYRFGTPVIRHVEVDGIRLYGRWEGDRVSFGSLDPLIYGRRDDTAGLPDLRLSVRDARALIETPWGAVGLSARGSGNLDRRFTGHLAIVAPDLSAGGCVGRSARVFGRFSLIDGAPRYRGPGRLAGLTCADAGLDMADLSLNYDIRGGDGLNRLALAAKLITGAVSLPQAFATGITGSLTGSWRDGIIRSQGQFAAAAVRSPYASAQRVALDANARADLARSTWSIDAMIDGANLRPGSRLEQQIGAYANAAAGTPAAPLARRAATNLAVLLKDSDLSARVLYRHKPKTGNVIVPEAMLATRTGQRIVSISQATLTDIGRPGAWLSGNIAIEGAGLPQLTARMERAARGGAILRVQMPTYTAGNAALSIPKLDIRRTHKAGLAFSGSMVASGPFAGGYVRQLAIPVEGRSQDSGLSLWPSCIDARFDSLRYANLFLEHQTIRVCPSGGRTIVAYDESGLRFAASSSSIGFSGRLGETPIRLAADALSVTSRGIVAASTLDVHLGQARRGVHFEIDDLRADLSTGAAGSFARADVMIDSVPLDVLETGGTWRYMDGALQLDNVTFVLKDRQAADRFQPLLGRSGSLRLFANVVTAQADLIEPTSNRLITQVAVTHDLATGSGTADLDVPGIRFDDELQPASLSRLALGVVANADGVVSGRGRIVWEGGTVTSTGSFSSQDLDFAAAFGPVKGASGTIRFDDLLGLTTAPDQRLAVRSVNPGIEVVDGNVGIALREGRILSVTGARWPFMGGTLTMQPVALNLGTTEERRYVFILEGLDAARFVAELGIGNLDASGIFDGTIAVVFDRAGDGRIEDGNIVSRPPGGNIAYVGELSYANLSPLANFAFDALKSLDYQRMTIGMEGPLTGEIVTTVRFDGVTQGAGASRNFVTRELGKLPLRFVVSIRAPFYQLVTSVRSLYDPAFVRDPRELGLIEGEGADDRTTIDNGKRLPQQQDDDNALPVQKQVSKVRIR